MTTDKHVFEGAHKAELGTVRPGLLGGATVTWFRRELDAPWNSGWQRFAEVSSPRSWHSQALYEKDMSFR